MLGTSPLSGIFIVTHGNALRLGIFLGFASFFFMEKTLRVLGGDEESGGHSHSHSHSQAHAPSDAAKSTGVESSAGKETTLRSRNTNNNANSNTISSSESQGVTNTNTNGPTKLSAYLNLFGDFVHNMCVVIIF